MEFIQKAEDFVRQMSYSMAFDPEPVYEGKKGLYNLMIEPNTFLKLLDEYGIDYPFKPENKIYELESLMKKEKFNSRQAISIVKNFIEHYWVLKSSMKRLQERSKKRVKEKR